MAKYFVVPRIKDIRAIEEFLNNFLPEVKYMVATGKTSNKELEKLFQLFTMESLTFLFRQILLGVVLMYKERIQ